ncbi:hypothetical protein PC9H_006725 [Pleurotus ostreatus]|uniref:Uncharacterized protein n=1 Tax=Pleurotus ostreatus TaxID=5322 RepID=A0A8H7DRS0_PLEOS|nr:uncharacterized protein PC9H_006725 [Pleurotus ostreatus]KAF7431010.1 hypothetical protein PC9H_006725 [Pleurotus ostreatus]
MNVALLLDSPSDEQRRRNAPPAQSISELDSRSSRVQGQQQQQQQQQQGRGQGGDGVSTYRASTPLYPSPIPMHMQPAAQAPIPPSPLSARPMPNIPAPYSLSDPSPMYHPPPPTGPARMSSSGNTTPTHTHAAVASSHLPPPAHPHGHSQAQSPAMASLRPLDPVPLTSSSTSGIQNHFSGALATSVASPHHGTQPASAHTTSRGYGETPFPTHVSTMGVGMLKGTPHPQPIMDSSSSQHWDRDRERERERDRERDRADRRKLADTGRSRSRHGSFTEPAPPLGSLKSSGIMNPPPPHSSSAPSQSQSQSHHLQPLPPPPPPHQSLPHNSPHLLNASQPPHSGQSRSRRGSLSHISNPVGHPGRVNTAPPQAAIVGPGVRPGTSGPGTSPGSGIGPGVGSKPRTPPMASLQQSGPVHAPLLAPSPSKSDESLSGRRDMMEEPLGPGALRERDFRERDREFRDRDMRDFRERDYRDRDRELREREWEREREREREREKRDREMRAQRDREDMEIIRAAASNRKQQEQQSTQASGPQQTELLVLKPNVSTADRDYRDRDRERDQRERDRNRERDRERERDMRERERERERERDLWDRDRERAYREDRERDRDYHAHQPPAPPQGQHHQHLPHQPHSHSHPPHHHPGGSLHHPSHNYPHSHAHSTPITQVHQIQLPRTQPPLPQNFPPQQQQHTSHPPSHQGSPTHPHQISSPYSQHQQSQQSPPLLGQSPGHHVGATIGPGIPPNGLPTNGPLSSLPPNPNSQQSNSSGPLQFNSHQSNMTSGGAPPILTGPGGVGPGISGPGVPPPGPPAPAMVGPGVGYGHSLTPPTLGGPGVGMHSGPPPGTIGEPVGGPGGSMQGIHHHHLHHPHHSQALGSGSGSGTPGGRDGIRDGIGATGRDLLVDGRDNIKGSRPPERGIVIIGGNRGDRDRERDRGRMNFELEGDIERNQREREAMDRERDRREREVVERSRPDITHFALGKDINGPLPSGGRGDSTLGGGPGAQRQFQSQFHTSFVTSGPNGGSRMSSPVPGSVMDQVKKGDREHERDGPREGASEKEKDGLRDTKDRQADALSRDRDREKRRSGGDSGLRPPATANVFPGAPSGPFPGSKPTTAPGATAPSGKGQRQLLDRVLAKGNESPMGREGFGGTGMMGGEEGPQPVWNGYAPPPMLPRGSSDYGYGSSMHGPSLAAGLGGRLARESLPTWPEIEVKARTSIHLGTFVYPKTPFPYSFWENGDLEFGSQIKPRNIEARDKSTEKPEETDVKDEATETEAADDKDLLDVDIHATIIIPHGFIPLERPSRPKIWGGGVLLGGTRRIYTDDSNLFLCALHSGWVTWSGGAAARKEGRDLKVEVRIIKSVGERERVEYNVDTARSRVASAMPDTTKKGVDSADATSLPSNAKNRDISREEVVGRFIGGIGAAFKELRGDDQGRRRIVSGESRDDDTVDEDGMDVDDADNKEDDGRSLQSSGWGSGHDGSAIEIIKAEFTTKSTGRLAPGLGRRNRAQRLFEYAERRNAVLGLGQPLCSGSSSCVLGRKRRRSWEEGLETEPYSSRRLPNATVLDPIAEEDATGLGDVQIKATSEDAYHDSECEEEIEMNARTVLFDFAAGGEIQAGFKYDPAGLKRVLFPQSDRSYASRPRKRRKVDDPSSGREATPMDVDDSPQPSTSLTPTYQPLCVLLETGSKTYTLSSVTPSSSDEQSFVRTYSVNLMNIEGPQSNHPVRDPHPGGSTPKNGTSATAQNEDLATPTPEAPSAPSDPASSPLPAISPSSRASSAPPQPPIDEHAPEPSPVADATEPAVELGAYVTAKLNPQDKPTTATLYSGLSEAMLHFTAEGITVLDAEAIEVLKIPILRWKCLKVEPVS